MKRSVGFSLSILILLLTACSENSLTFYKISGFTQGTSYHMTYAIGDSVNLKPEVDSILKDFDMSLSAWEENSLLSRINRNETNKTDEKFRAVFKSSKKVYEESKGAFDITVMPLVNAWGFGPGRKTKIEPEFIDSLLELVGMSKLTLADKLIEKENSGITIDVNAIAQGYSVDVMAEFFEGLGIENYMIEIGGELKTLGVNPKGDNWKIGIDRPEFGNMMPGMNMQAIISLSGKSLATSGNYRKFYEENGVKYSHSINPKTGYPVRDKLLSATVITDNCMDADAYATACMILGLDKAEEFIRKNDMLECYLIYSDEQGLYQAYKSKGFDKYLFKEIEYRQNSN